ncbi:MAG: alanine--tRNA ligase, partial [Limnochordia bacterium]|nr:alanine--tRNA ligase [Limnochordia bacterium]
MESWTGNELRERFLSYFESKGHKRLPSASLVPHNDPTLLLTGAGMVPFKPFFLGLETPQYRRVTTCQRCLRTADIDNVGVTARHGTFFEMLGNFSFGDYFKKEAIEFAWEFVTKHLKFPVERLWITIYEDDDEAFDLWHKCIGIPKDRIVRLGRKDNFWEIGVGPCGPCSELHYDRGDAYACSSDCKPGCDCERFLEFWNLVFIQYHQDEAGNLTRLDQTGIDTGMGLDRVATILQGVENIFEIDLMRALIDEVAQLAGCKYKEDPKKDVSLRVITDHMRGAVFLAHDGVVPSNEGRGYVFRRLLRRAVRHGRLLGIVEPFTAQLAEKVVQLMGVGYPEICGSLEYIQEVLEQEEDRFSAALVQGGNLLDEIVQKTKAQNQKMIVGADAFRLYDTYGFPVELTAEIAKESGLELDFTGFREEMEQQRQRARAAQHKSKGYLGDTEESYDNLKDVQCCFKGYESWQREAKIVALLKEGGMVDRVSSSDKSVEIVLDQTPFYAESGGQVADIGTVTSSQGQAQVIDVTRPKEGLIVHRVEILQGEFSVGDVVCAAIDDTRRLATARNHTATHLLHQALKDVLGDHVAQSGSQVTPEGLRFDFTHLKGLSKDELNRVERQVNEHILANLPVVTDEMEIGQALEQGAVHLFDEKYGERVRVVQV